MVYLLLFLPGSFFVWVIWKLGRGLYRRIFFDKIVEKHTSNPQSESVRALVQALEENDHASFNTLAASASITDLRVLLAQGDVADHEGRVSVFSGFARNQSKNANAHLLHGIYLIGKAWDARGGGYADSVTESGWDAFSKHLDSAEDALCRAIELNPDLPDAYENLLVVYRGQSDRQAAESLFQEAKKRFPTHLGIHQMMLVLLDGRWLGSADEAMAFARKHSDGDSTGTLAGLVPRAHFENWVSESELPVNKYFKQKPVRKEIQAAFKRFSTSPDADENLHGKLDILQYFALAFDVVFDIKNGRKAFKQMKGRYSGAAWNRWNDPKKMFIKAKWQATF